MSSKFLPTSYQASRSRAEPPPRSLAQQCPFSDLAAYPALSSSSLHFLRPLNNTTSPCPPYLSLPLLSIPIPTGVLSDLPFTETINFLAIWSGMIWVVRTAYKARKALSRKRKKEE